MSTASRSAADMLEVGCPEPALVEERIESTRSCAASSAMVSSPICAGVVVVIGDSCSAPAARGASVPFERTRPWRRRPGGAGTGPTARTKRGGTGAPSTMTSRAIRHERIPGWDAPYQGKNRSLFQVGREWDNNTGTCRAVTSLPDSVAVNPVGNQSTNVGSAVNLQVQAFSGD